MMVNDRLNVGETKLGFIWSWTPLEYCVLLYCSFSDLDDGGVQDNYRSLLSRVDDCWPVWPSQFRRAITHGVSPDYDCFGSPQRPTDFLQSQEFPDSVLCLLNGLPGQHYTHIPAAVHPTVAEMSLPRQLRLLRSPSLSPDVDGSSRRSSPTAAAAAAAPGVLAAAETR